MTSKPLTLRRLLADALTNFEKQTGRSGHLGGGETNSFPPFESTFNPTNIFVTRDSPQEYFPVRSFISRPCLIGTAKMRVQDVDTYSVDQATGARNKSDISGMRTHCVRYEFWKVIGVILHGGVGWFCEICDLYFPTLLLFSYHLQLPVNRSCVPICLRAMVPSSFKPAVPRHYLFAIAAVLWTVAGVILCVRGETWLEGLSRGTEFALEAASLALAVPGYLILFTKIVQKNIDRISRLPERTCLFAFTAWHGYLMIAVMMTIGITLRNTSIPKYYLSVPYSTMGVILLMGSFRFYRTFLVSANH